VAAARTVTGRDRAMNADLDPAVRRCLDSLRRDLLDGHPDALAAVEVERSLEAEARRGFRQAVAEARAEGLSWEQIAEHAGFSRHGVGAGEKLFEALAVPGGRLGDNHLSWRCGDCEGLVLDHGPYGEHPSDAEPGHHQDCARLLGEIGRYVAGRDRDDELAAGIAGVVSDHVPECGRWDRSTQGDGPGLELW